MRVTAEAMEEDHVTSDVSMSARNSNKLCQIVLSKIRIVMLRPLDSR